MIQTEGLSKRFDSFVAVDEVTLNVGGGQVLALLGPNGAGKTTTVRMLASVLRPSAGRALVANYDVVREPAKVRASVGVLTENHGLYNRMRAEEYLAFYGRIYGMSETRLNQRSDELLHLFGLAAHRAKRIGEFSKGMRQKLALARALLHDPPVLLLDEPTSAMDPESSRLVRDAIHELRHHERALIICTHNLPEAEELADQIAIIRRGRIIAQGTPAQLKDQLLGAPEFEVQWAGPLDGSFQWPEQADLLERGADSARFRSVNAAQINPLVLRSLLSQGVEVVSMQERPRNLEQVYLQAVQNYAGSD